MANGKFIILSNANRMTPMRMANDCAESKPESKIQALNVDKKVVSTLFHNLCGHSLGRTHLISP